MAPSEGAGLVKFHFSCEWECVLVTACVQNGLVDTLEQSLLRESWELSKRTKQCSGTILGLGLHQPDEMAYVELRSVSFFSQRRWHRPSFTLNQSGQRAIHSLHFPVFSHSLSLSSLHSSSLPQPLSLPLFLLTCPLHPIPCLPGWGEVITCHP